MVFCMHGPLFSLIRRGLFGYNFLVFFDGWHSADAYGEDQGARVLNESHEFKDICIDEEEKRGLYNHAIQKNKLLTLLFSDELDCMGYVYYLTSILRSEQTESSQYPGLPMTRHLWTQGPWIS